MHALGSFLSAVLVMACGRRLGSVVASCLLATAEYAAAWHLQLAPRERRGVLCCGRGCVIGNKPWSNTFSALSITR